MDETDLRWVTAEHEAGHAVMRWLRGLPATDIHVNNGYGLCEGTGEPVRNEDLLLVTLAGIVPETAYGLGLINLEESKFADLDEAREILETAMLLRIKLPTNPQPGVQYQAEFFSVEEALCVWFDKAVKELIPYIHVVEHVANAAFDGYLSAADLQTILQQYEQEL